MNVDELFAKNLKRFRKLNGWNQSELAENAMVSAKHIYKLEKGISSPTINMVNILAKTLGVSIHSFFQDENGHNVDFS